jgi:hypothetical protein
MKRLILILPINKRDTAREVLTSLSGEDCSKTLQADLNARGNADKASHCVLDWAMSDDLYAKLSAEFSKPQWDAHFTEGDPSLGKHPNKAKAKDFIEGRGLKTRRLNEVG